MCNQWVPLQGTKDVDVMVKEIFWYVLFRWRLLFSFLLFFGCKLGLE